MVQNLCDDGTNWGFGIGDCLYISQVIAGLKRERPEDTIIWNVPTIRMEWAKMCKDADELVWYPVPHDILYKPVATWHTELAEQGRRPRWQLYGEHCGCTLVAPTMIDIEPYPEWKDVIILAPFSSWKGRQWQPLQLWRILERMLVERGQRCLILDEAGDGERTSSFLSTRWWGQCAMNVARAVKAAKCVVSGDSGVAHIGAVLGAKTVVLTGPTVGERIYRIYGSHVACLQGSLRCSGCYWRSIDFHPDCDNIGCASMGTIRPQEVLAAIPT